MNVYIIIYEVTIEPIYVHNYELLFKCQFMPCRHVLSASCDQAFIIPSAASAGGFPDLCTFLCAKKAHEDYGEDLRKAICYVNGGGAIATLGIRSRQKMNR